MQSQPPALRALVVDDSALYRKIVRDVLTALPGVEVVGTASNGRVALDRIKTLRPDFVTLDLEMPELDGHGVLKRLAEDPDAPKTIIISAFTAQGAQATTAALQEGAFDFVLKPTSGSLDASVQQLRRDLTAKVDACRPHSHAAPTPAARHAPTRSPPRGASPLSPQIIGIGVSTGGPQTLIKLLPQLPADFPCPIALVQHMPPIFTASLAEDLDKRCALSVREARDGEPLCRGEIIVAPGGKQMRIVREDRQNIVQVTDDPPERNCKPSVDYLFRSLAASHGGCALGIVLTGMGDDGALGAGAIKARGGAVLAQDEASCVVYGMPRAVAEAGLADEVVPLDALASKICARVQRGVRA